VTAVGRALRVLALVVLFTAVMYGASWLVEACAP
jgi:hypothetical protein